jgi:hypothetical protein
VHSQGVRVQALADAECLALDAEKVDTWLGLSGLARVPLTAMPGCCSACHRSSASPPTTGANQ